MESLNVYMNGLRVGRYSRHANGANEFCYATQWLNTPGARPVSFSLPLRSTPFKGAEVYNFFDNLLPDNREIRERIVARYQSGSSQPFDLLTSIGRDCVGAIQLVPDGVNYEFQRSIDYSVLTPEKLGSILSGYKTEAPLGMLEGDDDFRISIAGAQEKTALLLANNQWCLPRGTTPTTHIFKLPIGEIKTPFNTLDLSKSVENEHFCLLIARELGFDVPDSQIIRVGEIKALAVERFDRKLSSDKSWLMRLPQEDFCQALGVGPGNKYESQGGPGINQIMAFLLGSSDPQKDRNTFMRAQVLFWLLGATDGHAKNFSLFINAHSGFQLTPLYDIISAYPITGGKGLNIRELKLAMGVSGTKGKKYQCEYIQPRHFLLTAKEVGFSEDEMLQILRYFYSNVPGALERAKQALPKEFPEDVVSSISKNMLRIHKRLTSLFD